MLYNNALLKSDMTTSLKNDGMLWSEINGERKSVDNKNLVWVPSSSYSANEKTFKKQNNDRDVTRW